LEHPKHGTHPKIHPAGDGVDCEAILAELPDDEPTGYCGRGRVFEGFKAFFSQDIPLWVTLSAALTFVGVAVLAVVQQRRSHKRALAAVNQALQGLQHDNATNGVKPLL
jgi:hypothetical protein